MNDETKFYATVAFVVAVFFGFLTAIIYIEKSAHNKCVQLIQDKPAIEILGVCK